MRFDQPSFFEAMDYTPHVGQQRLHESKSLYRSLACGARWGKSTACSMELCSSMAKTKEKLYWAVSLTYPLCKLVWDRVLWRWLTYAPDMVESYSESKMELELVTGTKCTGKSIDNPASLLGAQVAGMVYDECALGAPRIWEEFLKPRLIDEKGWALFPSTPKGKGWFWEMFKRGKNPEMPEYFSMEGPTWDNPHIDKEWLLASKSGWTDRYWQQEVLGMFLDDSGAVFKNIRGHVSGTLEEPRLGEIYVVGCDLAKHMDWTVITVMDMRGHVVYWERLPHEMSWPSIRIKVHTVSSRYNNATIYLDSSGIGDPTLDDLWAANAPAIGVPTAQEKTALIDALTVGLDNNRITYPDLPILLNEMEMFEHEKTSTGRAKYTAPEGFHDDSVISLALAWRGVNSGAYSSKPLSADSNIFLSPANRTPQQAPMRGIGPPRR